MLSQRHRSVDEIRQHLRQAGLRATAFRVALLQYLEGQSSPVSHEDAWHALSKRGINKSTIFRALRDLAKAGFARKLELGDHIWRFESAGFADTVDRPGKPHPHLLCDDCGTIICLVHDEVQLNVSTTIGTVEHVILKGRCSNCREGRHDSAHGIQRTEKSRESVTVRQ